MVGKILPAEATELGNPRETQIAPTVIDRKGALRIMEFLTRALTSSGATGRIEKT
jgi:hypothetical protein